MPVKRTPNPSTWRFNRTEADPSGVSLPMGKAKERSGSGVALSATIDVNPVREAVSTRDRFRSGDYSRNECGIQESFPLGLCRQTTRLSRLRQSLRLYRRRAGILREQGSHE